MEGAGFLVSWCVGHLAGLADATHYGDFKKWRYEDGFCVIIFSKGLSVNHVISRPPYHLQALFPRPLRLITRGYPLVSGTVSRSCNLI